MFHYQAHAWRYRIYDKWIQRQKQRLSPLRYRRKTIKIKILHNK